MWLGRASLRQRLALLLLPALLGVTAMGLRLTHADALSAADAAYDRSLAGALRSIDANISTASGGVSVELPYTMFEFFELTASGQVHFRVATSDTPPAHHSARQFIPRAGPRPPGRAVRVGAGT